jgi:hypothetical protein
MTVRPNRAAAATSFAVSHHACRPPGSPRPLLRLAILVAILLLAASPSPGLAQPFLTGPWLAAGDIGDATQPDFTGDRSEIVTGPGIGGPPLVKIFRVTQAPPSSGDQVGPGFHAYNQNFTGGVRVAMCDFDSGPPPLPPVILPKRILTGPGPGMAPRVRVFAVDADGVMTGMLADFVAFPAAFTGGVYVACGDVTGDGLDEIIVSAGWAGGSTVGVFGFDPDAAGGASLMFQFTTFTPAPLGGVRVAAGDVDDDGIDEVIVGRGSGEARVHVYKVVPTIVGGFGAQLFLNFLAFPTPPLRLGAGGVFVAADSLGGNSIESIVVGSGPGFPDRIRTFELSGGLLLTTLDLPIRSRLGAPFRTGIIVTAETLTAALDSEIVFSRYGGGLQRVRSVFFIGTTGRVDFLAY